MKILHSKRQLLALFMPGFLLGVLYVNLLAKKYVAEPGIFSEYFLDQFQTVKIEPGEYLWYLLRLRILPFLAVLALSMTKMRRVTAALFLLWTGMSAGILISTAVLSMGIRGSFLCLAGVFPQFIFYIPAYLILLWYCWAYPKSPWNRQKTVFVLTALAVGILLEIYVNPSVVRAFLSTL